jgi:hypothetical protein
MGHFLGDSQGLLDIKLNSGGRHLESNVLCFFFEQTRRAYLVSIEMPYFNLRLYVSSAFLLGCPVREQHINLHHNQPSLSKCISASGDGTFGSAFWWNLNGISLPIGRYPVIVRIIDGRDLTNVARQNI